MNTKIAQAQHARLVGIADRSSRSIAAVSTNASMLVYGSSGYGFNPSCYGKLDDVDMMVFVPRADIYALWFELASCFDDARGAVWHFDGLVQNLWDIVRYYGVYDGIRVGLRIMPFEELDRRRTLRGSRIQARAFSALDVESRLVGASLWSMVHSRYRYSKLACRLIELPGRGAGMCVRQGVFSPRGTFLGTFGRKVLSGRVAHDPSGRLTEFVDASWRNFVHQYRSYRPGVTPIDLVDALYRRPRFASEHVQTLVHKVSSLY